MKLRDAKVINFIINNNSLFRKNRSKQLHTNIGKKHKQVNNYMHIHYLYNLNFLDPNRVAQLININRSKRNPYFIFIQITRNVL